MNTGSNNAASSEDKMKNTIKKSILIIAAVIVGIILLSGVFYVVHQKEAVVIRQFGKIVNVNTEPGLKVKIPFIQSVQRISLAVRLYDIPASDVITKDKKSMIADDYVIWEVTDPTKYVQALGAVDMRAEERIEAAVYNATKNTISSMTQDDVIAARGEALTSKITSEANSDIGSYGIRVIISEIKALDLPDDNKEAVYQRMISERQNIAASYTAQGNAEAQKIRNETDKSVRILEAEAKKEAEKLEAEGEAEYMAILSEAYNSQEKADFYSFTRSLDALKLSLSGGEKTILLDKDSELARLLYGLR